MRQSARAGRGDGVRGASIGQSKPIDCIASTIACFGCKAGGLSRAYGTTIQGTLPAALIFLNGRWFFFHPAAGAGDDYRQCRPAVPENLRPLDDASMLTPPVSSSGCALIHSMDCRFGQ